MAQVQPVSVVIPTYQATRTIGRAIDSVLGQTSPPGEVIVVDDGSTDDLASALGDRRERVRLIRQENAGAAAARNRGIEETIGEFITFLDADDYWEPDKLRRQMLAFDQHPELGLVASRYYKQRPNSDREVWTPELDHTGFGFVVRDEPVRATGSEAYTLAMRIWTSTVLVRRQALGTERFVSGLEPAEDRDLWLRIILKHAAYMVDEPLATHVLEPDSLSRSNIDRDFANMIRVLHRHRHILRRRQLWRWEAMFYRLWAACHLGDGNAAAAVAPALHRLAREPFSPRGLWLFLKAASGALHQWHHSSADRLSTSKAQVAT